MLTDDPLWYQNAILYELHVRAYADSNGDGIGDFPGLLTKLDYLQDLGVTAIWLLPFYPSPLRDDGYDIADYTNVHPNYGTLDDFKAFLDEAHRRGLRVITELVVNHTSDQHPWFQRARRAPKGSPERDFYVWSDDPHRYAEARIIFKDFETSNWTWDPVANSYFWHRFYGHQPDLNYDNPAVHAAVVEALDFWLGMGIDGLRLDAVPYLYERDGTNCENLPETHAFLKKLRAHVDSIYPNRMLLAEANQWPEDASAYFGNGDECHMNFHFPLMPRLFMAQRMEDRFPIVDILEQTPAIPDNCQWAIFLRNHDELTLEMVTDEDRDYMYRLYAQDPQARINLGIRRRLAPLLENHRARIELMNGLLLSLPGTPVLYYGDEIGMGDNIYLGDRNGVRTPMQWSAERNAGFSRANPQRLYLPVIIDPEFHYSALNVEAQQNQPHSLLWWTKRLLALRKRFKALGHGSLEFLAPENAKVLAFVRRYPPHPQPLAPEAAARGWGEGEETLLVVANLSRFTQYVELDLSEFQGLTPVELMGRTKFPPVGTAPYFLTLGPQAFYWFSLEHRRGERPQPAVAEWPTLRVDKAWEEVFHPTKRTALEEVLPAHLETRLWFHGRGRALEAVQFRDVVPVPFDGAKVYLTLAQVRYTEDEPETYFLPLAFATGGDAERVQRDQARAVVARLTVNADGGQGVLYDPAGEPWFCNVVLRTIARQFQAGRGEAALRAHALSPLAGLYDPQAPLPDPVVREGDHGSTAATFGDRLHLKILRHVHEGVHPGVEMGRFLQERTEFRNVPPLAGYIEYRPPQNAALTLAVLEGQVANQGDAWHYFRGLLGRYYEHALTQPASGGALAVPRHPLAELAEAPLPPEVADPLGAFLEPVRLLARRTAEFHLALTTPAGEPDFAPEPFTTLLQRSLYQSVRSQVLRALEVLRRRHKGLPAEVQDLARQVLGREGELVALAQRIVRHKLTTARTRYHGDLHLGCVLSTGKDFAIVDLEGNARRPVSDRRRKRSPLRDVATLLRSFHYVTLAAVRRGGIRAEDVPALEPWRHFWQLWTSVAFVQEYRAVAAGAVFLPESRGELDTLLTFYLLKRTGLELRDDLLHRPDRVQVPLEGLLQLLEVETER